jgi:hypothetical protein
MSLGIFFLRSSSNKRPFFPLHSPTIAQKKHTIIHKGEDSPANKGGKEAAAVVGKINPMTFSIEMRETRIEDRCAIRYHRLYFPFRVTEREREITTTSETRRDWIGLCFLARIEEDFAKQQQAAVVVVVMCDVFVQLLGMVRVKARGNRQRPGPKFGRNRWRARATFGDLWSGTPCFHTSVKLETCRSEA